MHAADPEFVQRLRHALACEGDFKVALLFGSQASGTATEDSDIDIALLGDEPLTVAKVIAVVDRLGPEFDKAIDIIDLYHAPEPVTGEALHGLRLLGNDEDFAELLIRHLDNVEDFIPLQRRILDERRSRWLR